MVDASDFESTVWPRMSCIAERLWSPAVINDIDAALPRLQQWRCNMLQRGVGVDPIGLPGRTAPEYNGFNMSCAALPPEKDFHKFWHPKPVKPVKNPFTHKIWGFNF